MSMLINLQYYNMYCTQNVHHQHAVVDLDKWHALIHSRLDYLNGLPAFVLPAVLTGRTTGCPCCSLALF